MGKTGKLRKKRRLNSGFSGATSFSTQENESTMSAHPGISTSDVQTTVKVLQAMAESPSGFTSKEFKSLRGALHKLRQSEGAAMVLGFGLKELSPVQYVSDALRDSRWTDALKSMEQMRQRGFLPKLGSVQRWVRECDAAGDADPMAIQVLDAILRTADPPQVGAMQSPTAIESLRGNDGTLLEASIAHGGFVHAYPPWDAFTRKGHAKGDLGGTLRRGQGQSEEEQGVWRALFRVCAHVAPADRKPPNKYPLRLHTSEEGAISLDPPLEGAPRRVDVPFVPGAFLLADLFSAQECIRMVSAAEAVVPAKVYVLPFVLVYTLNFCTVTPPLLFPT
jgi:hypothetical protein